MSSKNRVAKAEARTRLEQDRARARTRTRSVRRTAALLSALAVAITAVAVGIALTTGSARAYDAATDAPTGTVGPDRLTIRLGMPAPATLTIFEDARCAACGRFERDFHAAIEQLEREGKLQVDYHILSSVDPDHGSREAATALACAQNAGRFTDFHTLLFAGKAGRSDADASEQHLAGLAAQVAGLDVPVFRGCLSGGTFTRWVDVVQADFQRTGHTAVPTVLLNGVPAYPAYRGAPTTPATLIAWVDRLDGAKPGMP